MIIGVFGYTYSGKTKWCNNFIKDNPDYYYINVDQFGKNLYKEKSIKKILYSWYGSTIFNDDEIDLK